MSDHPPRPSATPKRAPQPHSHVAHTPGLMGTGRYGVPSGTVWQCCCGRWVSGYTARRRDEEVAAVTMPGRVRLYARYMLLWFADLFGMVVSRDGYQSRWDLIPARVELDRQRLVRRTVRSLRAAGTPPRRDPRERWWRHW